MNEEMRKEFEEWYEREGKAKPFTTISIKDKMHEAWKASREAMKPIKLPHQLVIVDGDYDTGYSEAYAECKEAIQQSGYKVEE